MDQLFGLQHRREGATRGLALLAEGACPRFLIADLIPHPGLDPGSPAIITYSS